jgi:hypothetical protein
LSVLTILSLHSRLHPPSDLENQNNWPFEIFSLGDLRANVALVRKFYSGRIVEAEDLECIVIEE